MTSNLIDIAYFVSEKINIEELNDLNYISTENMLPDKGGITKSSGLPNTNYTQGFSEGDILLSNIRPYFKKIWYATFNGGCSNDVLVLRAKSNVCPKFLYYVLSDDKFFEYDTATSKGTKMPRGDKVAIMKYGAPKYDLPKQEKIARILSSLDDKIELNNKINQNLEQQAQAIFDKYIKIPCNYLKTGTIGDYCSVKSGFAFKSSWWKDSGVKVIKIKTIDNKSINFAECSFVDKEKISIAEDFIVQGGDLIIAMTGATIGKFAIVPKIDEVLLVNQRVGKFFLGTHPIKKLPFLYCTLKQQDIINDIINKGQGSAQPNISSTDILNTSCYILENAELEKFNLTCEPIFEKIITNKYENEKLKQLRDTLLPKLMSGEIDVDKVNP